MLKVSKLKKDERGSGLILCIIVLFLMLGMGVLVVDASILYKAKGEMRKAANAAALSGAQVMFNNDAATAVTNVVTEIVDANNENGTLQLPLSPTIPNDENKVTVTLKKSVPLYFTKVFGIPDPSITVTSSAEAEPLGGASGAMPLGVSMASIGLTEDMKIPPDMEWKQVTLKTSPSDTNYGKYGLISFPGDSGASDYKENLENGYPGEVEVGDTLNTESGSVAADDSIMESKITNSKYTSIEDVKTAYANNTLNYSDSRIMLIIVYKEGAIIDASQNIREITVAGFAYFYLDSYIKDGNDRNIEGYFIPRIYGSIGDAKALNLGAYAIKLVE